MSERRKIKVADEEEIFRAKGAIKNPFKGPWKV